MQKRVKVAVIPIKISKDKLISLMKMDRTDKEYIKYTQKIINKLEEAIENNAEIIVFPELSIPVPIERKTKEDEEDSIVIKNIKESIIRKMEELNKKQSTLIVIAGSHYRSYKELLWDNKNKKFQEKERVYNVSPILFYQNGEVIVYEQFKNNTNSDEEKNFFEKLKNNRIFPKKAELGKGTGCLKFETKLGRIAVLICYDGTDRDLIHNLRNKTDMLIVPSWQEVKGGTTNRYENIAHEYMYWVIFANNEEEGGSRLFGPIKNAKSNEAKESLKPAIEGSEEIKYLIVTNGIRRLQEGEEDVKDADYVYGKPRAGT